MRLAGTRALVTGSSRGLGRGVALALGQEGAAVALHGSKASRDLVEASEQVRALGRQAVPVAFDATKRAAVEQGVSWAAQQLGGLDALVHCVGANFDAAFLDMDDERWQRAMKVNLDSAFLCAQAATRLLRGKPRSKPGRIVLVAAASALTGRRGAANYVASKGGVVALTRSLALELAPEVLVNCLAPGVFETASVRALFDAQHLQEAVESVPLSRLGRPEELAEAAVFLCSGESSFVTGQVLVVDGGRAIR